VSTSSQLLKRSSIASFAVIVAAVAMLGLLVTQTEHQRTEMERMADVQALRVTNERLLEHAIAARATTAGAARDAWRPHLRAAVAEWRRARRGGSFADSSTAPVRRAERAVATLADADLDSLVNEQHLFVSQSEDRVAQFREATDQGIDQLVMVEAICVILLLAALGLGVRLALRPAHLRLEESAAALADNESRTRAVLDAMDEGMLLVASDGTLLTWNPSALRLLGVDRILPGTKIFDFGRSVVTLEGVPYVPDQLPAPRTLRSGLPLSREVLGIVTEAGDVRWISVDTHPLRRTPDEMPYACLSVFHDITDERQLEEERAIQAQAQELQNQELLEQAEALERGQALFRSLVDTAGSAIVGVRMDGSVFEWNREAEALFGVPRADALGRDYVGSFATADYRSQIAAGIDSVLEGQVLRNLVWPVNSARGERRTVIWNITPLRAGGGGPVHGLIAAGVDITEREASDERFRILFERSSDAHLLLDETGVIDCNDATLRMLRCVRKSEVLGRSSAELSPHRQPDGRLSLVVASQMLQRARDHGFYRFEWTHQRSDGSVFPVEVTLTPVRLNGREVILAVWHDIAERKKVEDALRAAKDAAESANRTKSEFMTRMNHELRTPLTAIIGFSRVLLQGKEGPLTPNAQLYAERIRANGMHLLSLINQILDVAKVEAGRMELETETVAVDTLVRDTLAMLESTAHTKGIALHGRVPDTVAPIVTDAGKLRQILINLIGNAIKFTSVGEVNVVVETDPATSEPVSISVRDTGIGIPPDRQQKVFEPFEQGDSSTRREFGGTGLGLSIVKAFAELIGAAIEVESELGRGTTFTVWLPSSATPAKTEAPAPALAG
jgi:PAS domain S-box-containing protein